MTSSTLLRGGRRALLLAGLALAVSACGFQLRGSNGSYNLPFNKLYIGLPESSPLAIDLKRNIRAIGSTEITSNPAEADGQVVVLTDPEKTRGKSILSLNSNGRVREYQLSYNIVFTVRDGKGNVLLGENQITLTRPITFDESQLLAKETEEAMLYRDMQKDLVQQMLRRMATIKPVINASPAVLTAPAPDGASGSTPAMSPVPVSSAPAATPVAR